MLNLTFNKICKFEHFVLIQCFKEYLNNIAFTELENTKIREVRDICTTKSI